MLSAFPAGHRRLRRRDSEVSNLWQGLGMYAYRYVYAYKRMVYVYMFTPQGFSYALPLRASVCPEIYDASQTSAHRGFPCLPNLLHMSRTIAL